MELLCSQIARLRSELDIVRGNIKVMSEMLTELVPGQEDASDLELLQVTFVPYPQILQTLLMSTCEQSYNLKNTHEE